MMTIISSCLSFNTNDSSWRKLVLEEQKKSKIQFDLENNDHIGSVKIIEITGKNERQFFVQLWCASGDWELPVYYFKIQPKSKDCDMIVFIPSYTDGNGNLVRDGNKFKSKENCYKKDDKRNEGKAWYAVNRFLKNKCD